MATAVKYTNDQETELISGYQACNTDDDREKYIEIYATKHSKSRRSVIAKLSKLGIYIARKQTSKVTGDKPQTKEQILGTIALKLGMNVQQLEGMQKSPKLALQNLLKRVSE